jgi:hypothetical protein
VKKQKDLRRVPKEERWLYKNKEALASVKRGLKDAAEGRVSKLDPKLLAPLSKKTYASLQRGLRQYEKGEVKAIEPEYLSFR